MLWLSEGVFRLTALINLVTVVAGLVALLDAALRPAPAYEAAGKLTKPGWLLILGVSFLVLAFWGMVSFIGPFALVAIIVYLVDVRPAVRALGGRGKGGQSGPTNRW